jgi:glycerophosphoryl diester phosphodiesterase
MTAKPLHASRQFITIGITSLTLWLGCVSTLVACPLSPTPKPDLPERGISAHRGGRLGCPVNTIEAFQRAICRGVHQIEIDVRTTVDNILVIAHDDQVTGQDQTLRISESPYDQVKDLDLAPCHGATKALHIPTLEQALAIMPQNIWINVDIKNNDPHVGQLVAEIVGRAHRFDQVIFAARDKAALAIRRVALEAGETIFITNMNRELFRYQYVEATIQSCADFIQLITIPYFPFVRGKPGQDTMTQLQEAGVRINYSWLREQDGGVLKNELHDLFTRGVDFVLVDHVEQAMEAAAVLGVPPLMPRWSRTSLPPNESAFSCPATQ